HHDEVDRDDAVMMTLLLVHAVAAPVEDPAVHQRMERLHAPAEELRESGDLPHVADGDAGAAEGGGGAAGGYDLHAVAHQTGRQLAQAGLVPDRQERAADPDL